MMIEKEETRPLLDKGVKDPHSGQYVCDFMDCTKMSKLSRGGTINGFLIQVNVCSDHSKVFEKWITEERQKK